MLLAFAAFHLWLLIAGKIWPTPPQQTATPQPAGQESTADPDAQPAAAETHKKPTTPVAEELPDDQLAAIVSQGTQKKPVTLGYADDGSPYPMSIDIVPTGAAVSCASVRDYDESVKNKIPYPILKPVNEINELGRQISHYSFVTKQVRFEKHDLNVPLDKCVWNKLFHGDERSAWYVDILDPEDKKPLAKITKTYELKRQTKEDKTYDLGISLRIDNLSDGPLNVKFTQLGPIGFRTEDPRGRGAYHNVMAAAWQEGEFVYDKCVRSNVFSKKNVPLFSDNETTRVAWAAQSNKYFACIMTFADRNNSDDIPRFESLDAINLTDIKDESLLERKDLTFRFVTTPVDIPAGSAKELNFDCYLGPKAKDKLENVPKYSQRNYYAVISETIMWCAPEAIVNIMISLLKVFYKVPPNNYGIAIIILVLAVKGLLHPITKKSQANMMKMQKNMSRVQPKIQAVKEKFANDRVKLNKAIMEVYREEGINPAGNVFTCLPMFIQMPIWVSLWTALSLTIEMRHAHFFWWMNDLSAPDAFYTFGKPISIPILGFLMGGPIHSLNILPILLAVSQWLQARYMPRGNPATKSNKNPDQLEQQRKMMQFMSLFFMFILYNAPSGLCLYILSSNMFGILEQWRIRKHLEEEDKKHEAQMAVTAEAAAAGKIKPRNKTWLIKMWESLEKGAEDAKKVQSPKKKQKTKSRR